MTVLNIDCVEGMRLFPDAYFDSIVTDPPYELGFMGKAWDASGIANNVEMWREGLRVLKPGGHLLAFSGSRTYHRMVCAIEDAGFEIRDQIMWVYGSGFPKSLNLSGDWQGWGTALKPARKPIVVARKPLVGTVAANVLQFGTGALNIDGCRVPTNGETTPSGSGDRTGGRIYAQDEWTRTKMRNGGNTTPDAGRWPANLIHDGSDEVLAEFPQASGALAPVTGNEPSAKTDNTFGEFGGRAASDKRDGGGSAARFFYCAKTSVRDRNEGLESFTARTEPAHRRTNIEETGDNPYLRGATERRNTHPTVKPTELMRYLVRLVTPPGGTVLDPFAGSGSTGKACALEGFGFLGFELSPEYTAIAHARIEGARRVA